ncbi:guanine deaminase [Hyphococcus sp.]|uniref:guanine deaminase n=1 Tax=Hyphococcus sp. TaxID=2038636 RepID=UPI003CCC3524
MALEAFRAQILYVNDDPLLAGNDDAVRFFDDGLLLVENGYVVNTGSYVELADSLPAGVTPLHFKNCLITPGFIDTHIHYPQTDIIGAHGAQLLDWLERYTYPAEAAFADPAHARETAQFFLRELLRNGTTTALVFASSHADSVDAIFEAALEKSMRLYAGKVLMDQNADAVLCDGADLGRADTVRLIEKWRGKGRLGYAVTPRFALTSSAEQLRMAGEILRDYPDVLLQTHLSENYAEIEMAARLFPEASDYLDIYARNGLLTGRSVFAHALHMDAGAFNRIADANAAISFCPSSNLFLGSGLFSLKSAHDAGAQVSLGTDVGAGASFSMLHIAQNAYKVAQMNDNNLDPFTLFYLATLGGARALNAGDRIGHLAPGAEADFLVLDYAATPLIERRMRAARDLQERLFAFMILGDDRAVKQTYIAGALAHDRDGAA